jgi:hypothetical protein
VTDIEVLYDASDPTYAAITACDSENITFANGAKEYEIDKDDTTILYIDFDGKTADSTGTISTADKYDYDGVNVPTNAAKLVKVSGATTADDVYYYANAFYKVGSDTKTLDLLVVDVNNDWNALR